MKIDTTDKFYEEKSRAIKVLKTVIDPELGVNLVDLGLIYDLDFSQENTLNVKMTFSTPFCPLGETIENGVRNTLTHEFKTYRINVEIVWEPEWTPELLTEDGKLQLGMV